jgi:hypothetical protein
MKNNQLTGMLLGLVFLSTLASAGLMMDYNHTLHKIQDLQGQPGVAAANAAQTVMQSLLNDTIEYAKTTKNPEIARLVQGVTGGKSPLPASKPAK